MSEFNQLCFYNDVPVGLITVRRPARAPLTRQCKLVPPPSAGPGERQLYISTLGVLAPYRRQGLATRMVDYVAEAAINGVQVPPPAIPGAKKPAKPAPPAASSSGGKSKEPPPPTVTAKITRASIHVHTANTDAREFWERQGFEVRRPSAIGLTGQVESTIDLCVAAGGKADTRSYYNKLEVRSDVRSSSRASRLPRCDRSCVFVTLADLA